ncbi:MAG: hypothetical protein GWO24_27460, partial [Akkermansiaceae bacterium]|nr:hypothetical protein [Akkermansiaceae bacterium]
KCDEKGRALIPFSNEPGARTPVIEGPGGFASLARFQHPAETYELKAGMRVDREALRPGAKASIVVRPTLSVAGRPISLTRLSGVSLVLISTDLDGVSTTDTVPEFEIGTDREATYDFRVPDRLASLTAQLRAKVKVASQGGKEIDLSDRADFKVNDQLRSERVDDLYLSRIDGGHVLELLGRTGEARSGQNVNVTVRRSGFQNTRRFTL